MIRASIKGRLGRRLAHDDTGVTIVEFALTAPVFLMMLIGMLDVGQMIYGQTLLNGAVEAAARSSSLEAGDVAEADERVKARIGSVLDGVRVTTQRTNYYDFADIGRAEQLNDADGNGSCNNGEAYTDENSNGSWDRDVGVSGNGGANDVVIYTVSARYTPLFKVPFVPHLWAPRTLSATALRKNQPYANQASYSSQAKTCT